MWRWATGAQSRANRTQARKEGSMNTNINPQRRGFLVGGLAGSVAVVFGSLAVWRSDVAASGTERPVNAYVHFGGDGYITLINPAIEMGQGSSTALAQVVADALDADWSRIRVKPAPYDDTYGNPHFAGRLVTADSAATNAFWPGMGRWLRCRPRTRPIFKSILLPVGGLPIRCAIT